MTELQSNSAAQEHLSPPQEYFSTSKGSKYYLLGDGRTQRFKTATQEWHHPQDIIVFVPSYKALMSARPTGTSEAEFQGIFGINETQYIQDILEMLHDTVEGGKRKWRVSIVNQEGAELKSNAEKTAATHLFLKFASTIGDKVLFIPVSGVPKNDFQPFDKRWYVENGNSMSSQHLGNKIVAISPNVRS